MRLVFPTRPEVKYPWENIFQTFNVRTVTWGTESLSHLGPKIWALIPLKLKKFSSLYKLKVLYENGSHPNAPVDYASFILPQSVLSLCQIKKSQVYIPVLLPIARSAFTDLFNLCTVSNCGNS